MQPESPFEFRKATLEAIAPPSSGRASYRDSRMPRLYLRVTPAGTKTFYCVRKVKGKTEWVRLGAFPEMGVGLARMRSEEENSKFLKGENPAEERRAARSKIRSEPILGNLWESYRASYLRGETRGGGRSVKTLDSQWRVWLSRWEGKRITTITDTMVEKLRNEIAGTRSKTLANKILTHGRSMYGFAAKSRQIKYTGLNPFTTVEKFSERRSRKQRLMQSDIGAFFAGLDTVSPLMRDFFTCCLFIGARSGNIKTMRWEDVKLEEAVWTLPYTKSGDSHEVSLAEPVIELLQARKREGGEWVFPGDSESGHLVTYRRAWLKVCGHAGIKNLRVHDLRRTLSSWAQEANVSVALVQAQLGHLDPKTTLKHYTTIAGRERRSAVDSTVRAMIDAAKETKH